MIYVCIPAHDEARTVGVLLWKIRKVMRDFDREYRILVLDDASTDDTAEVLDRYEAVLPLTVIRSDDRLGYGAAVERLLRETVRLTDYPKRDCAVVLQADLTEDPADIVPLVKILEGGADIVAGTLDEPPDEPRSVRLARWVAPRLLGRTYRSAPVSDPLTGLRAYRIVVLRKAFRDEGDGAVLTATEPWAVHVELLKALAPHARRIEEGPVGLRSHLLARSSRFRPLRNLRTLLRFRGHDWSRSEAGSAA